jgi:hypothetical protein
MDLWNIINDDDVKQHSHPNIIVMAGPH